MEIKINPEFERLIPPLAADEFAQLENLLLTEGIRDALVIARYPDENAEETQHLADGHNRYRIATKHGLQYRTQIKDFASEDDVVIWIIDNQKGRRNLTDFVKLELAEVKAERLRRKNLDRKKEFGAMYGRGNTKEKVLSTIDKTFIDDAPHNTRNEIAADLGWSTGKVAMGQKVMKDAPEEVKAQVRAGEMSINQAYKEVKASEKKTQRIQEIEEIKHRIASNPLNKVTKKYHVICIDPPWAYEEKGGFSANEHNPDSNRGGVDYPTMTVDQIRGIDLPAADDCVLFLWTTHAFLEDSFSLLRSWGFQYKATMVWDKEKMGIGRTIRMQVEFCLLAVKGSPIIQGSAERDIIREPRREHSRKPEAFYRQVERMCIGIKLDYFSREYRENWDVYGAETGKF